MGNKDKKHIQVGEAASLLVEQLNMIGSYL